MAETQLNSKTSFTPISSPEIEVLILGTLPGDMSLQVGEYFAHPRNRFWSIIAGITKNPLPQSYPEKLVLLEKTHIGVWNVLQRAERKGSLDSAIKNAMPNELPAFIARHPKLRVIAFDGQKPETFYDKYFERKKELKYVSLPSCSPANARFSLEDLYERWKEIIDY